jgi:hypothetical protein
MPLDKSKFQKPAAKAASANVGGAGKAKSRWAGMRSSAPRDPFPHVGTYRFRVSEIEKGFNPGKQRESIKTRLVIVDADDKGQESHAIGDQVFMLNFMTTAGTQEFQAFVTAAAGFEDDDAFVAECGDDGAFVDALLGQGTYPATLLGRLVDCQVTRGKDDGTGDYYRKYSFAPVSEEEQDETPNVAAQKAA